MYICTTSSALLGSPGDTAVYGVYIIPLSAEEVILNIITAILGFGVQVQGPILEHLSNLPGRKKDRSRPADP